MRAQASLEMTVALMGAILLLFGSLKVFLWMTERLVIRHQHYEDTRESAASTTNMTMPAEPAQRLEIFSERR